MKRVIKYSFIPVFLCVTHIASFAQQNIDEKFPEAKRIVKVAVYPTFRQIWNENYFISLSYEKPLVLMNYKVSVCHIGEYYSYKNPKTVLSIGSSSSSSSGRNIRLTYRADLRYYIGNRKPLEGFFVGFSPFLANEQLSGGEIKRTSLGVGLTLGYQKEIFKRFTLEVNPFFGLGASHYQRTLNNEEITGIDERYFFGLSLNVGRILKMRE